MKKVFRSLRDLQNAFGREARWGQSAQAPDTPTTHDSPEHGQAPRRDGNERQDPPPSDEPDQNVIEKTLPTKRPDFGAEGD